MSRYFDSNWFRNGILLVALAAGGLATMVVPSYEYMAALYHEPEKKSVEENPHHTGVEIDHHRLQYVRHAS